MARLTLLLSLLLAGVTVGTVVDLYKRIYGGEPCKRPFHVRLKGSNTTHKSTCGGSLISDKWILTAAHCWIPGWTMEAILDDNQGTGQGQTVQITNPPVIYTDGKEAHDIMLLNMSNPTSLTPVELPNCSKRIKPGAEVQVAGHGPTTAGPNKERHSNTSSVLHCGNFSIIDCNSLVNTTIYKKRKHQHFICGSSSTMDTCGGDSGGGVLYQGQIYGVHSFTWNHTHTCSAPVGFMDVCEYIVWIRNISSPTKAASSPTRNTKCCSLI